MEKKALAIKESYEKNIFVPHTGKEILLFHALPYFYIILERAYTEAILVLASE